MNNFKVKKYCNFEEFIKDANNLTQYIKNNTADLKTSDKINYARRVYSKQILNSYICVGRICNETQKLLNCSSYELKFSIDNMIKNQLAHNEILNEDYYKIPLIIKAPSKYFKSKSGYDVVLFKNDEKYYKLVIKTTKNRKENFVKSLHLLNKDRYLKY